MNNFLSSKAGGRYMQKVFRDIFTKNRGNRDEANVAWKRVEQHLLGNHDSEYCRRRECSQPGYTQKFTATDGRDRGIIRNFIGIYGSDSVWQLEVLPVQDNQRCGVGARANGCDVLQEPLLEHRSRPGRSGVLLRAHGQQ